MVKKPGLNLLSCIGLVMVLSIYAIAQGESSLVSLEYKFHPGEMLSYQIQGEGKGTVEISGLDTSFNFGSPGNGQMPITLGISGYLSMSTKQVNADNSGEIDLTFDNFVEKIEMMNQKMVFTFSKGKYQMEMNGQQLLSSDSSPQLPFFDKPISYTMSKSGKITMISGLDWMKQLMPAMSKNFDFNDILKQMQPYFPEHPVRIGDSWASTTDCKLSETDKDSAKMVLHGTVTGIEMINGKRCAVIQYTGKFDLADWKLNLSDTTENKGLFPEMNFKNMRQTITGKSYHALDVGQMIKGEFQQQFGMELNLKMPMPDPKTNRPLDITTKMDLTMQMGMELKK
ncbi:MAG: DUF6263 family protein [bacterium]